MSLMHSFKANDPNTVYRLGSIFSYVGVLGTILTVLIRGFVNSYIYARSDNPCTNIREHHFHGGCLAYIMERRGKNIGWSQISHLISILFSLVLLLPMYIMEDTFSEFEYSGAMRQLLCLGIVIDCLHNAFHVGIRSSCGAIAKLFRPRTVEGVRIDPYPGMHMAYIMADNSFNWVTFARYLVLATGIYLACHYDKEGGTVISEAWRIIGYVACIAACGCAIFDILRVANYSYFNNLAWICELLYNLFFLGWVWMFGRKCKSLYKPDIDVDTSGSEISDDDNVNVVTVSNVRKDEEEDEEAPKDDGEKKKKKRRKHKKEEGEGEGGEGEEKADVEEKKAEESGDDV